MRETSKIEECIGDGVKWDCTCVGWCERKSSLHLYEYLAAGSVAWRLCVSDTRICAGHGMSLTHWNEGARVGKLCAGICEAFHTAVRFI